MINDENLSEQQQPKTIGSYYPRLNTKENELIDELMHMIL